MYCCRDMLLDDTIFVCVYLLVFLGMVISAYCCKYKFLYCVYSVYFCVFIYCIYDCILLFFFFFKQKTAYEMRISDWSSDVCSSDLNALFRAKARLADFAFAREAGFTVKVPFRPQDDRHKQHRQRHAYDRASPERFGHDRIMAVIPEEAGEPERIISRGGHLEKEPRHRPGQQADQQQCDRKEDKGQREPVRACFLDQNISPSRESGLRPSWFTRPHTPAA